MAITPPDFFLTENKKSGLQADVHESSSKNMDNVKYGGSEQIFPLCEFERFENPEFSVNLLPTTKELATHSTFSTTKSKDSQYRNCNLTASGRPSSTLLNQKPFQNSRQPGKDAADIEVSFSERTPGSSVLKITRRQSTLLTRTYFYEAVESLLTCWLFICKMGFRFLTRFGRSSKRRNSLQGSLQWWILTMTILISVNVVGGK